MKRGYELDVYKLAEALSDWGKKKKRDNKVPLLDGEEKEEIFD